MKKLFLVLLVTVSLIACDKDPGKTPPIGGDKLITKIEKIDNRTDGVRGSELTEFFYDNLNRVNKVVYIETEIEGEGSAEKTNTWIGTCVITYASNTVSYYFTQTINGIPYKDGEGKGEITLDSNGRAISGKGSYLEEHPDEVEVRETKYTYLLGYNGDGYLTKSENSNNTDITELTWTNGNLAQVWWGMNSNKDMIDKALYGNTLNKTNLDLNWFHATGLPLTEGFAFACGGDSQNIFSLLGYVGNRAKNLVEQVSAGFRGETDYIFKHNYIVDADGYPTMIELNSKRYYTDPQGNDAFKWEKQTYKITYNK